MRNDAYVIRRRYDRLREAVDKMRDKNKKIYLLRALDQMEPTLLMIEEQPVSLMEKRRMIRYLNTGIGNIGDMLHARKEVLK